MTTANARRRTKKPSLRPCVFKEPFIREQIDPRVKEIWAKHPGGAAPFGRLRRAFQQGHCSKINFYTGSDCPYRVEECAMAFLSGVQNSTLPWIEDPAAYFVKLVISTGIDRADNKPLAREHHRETGQDVAAGRQGRSGPGPRGHEGVRSSDEADLRRAAHRPEPIGDLLGSLDLGSHPRPERDGRGQAEGDQ